TAVAQSATPTTGNVGSATLRNGFPSGGGAVALPGVPNSSPTGSTPVAATTTTTSASLTTGTTGTGANSTGSGASGQTGGGGGGGGASRGGGSASTSTAGAATATGSSGSGTNWVLCPPSGAPGLEPLFTGTDLSCAPQ